jgi:hypothetical protein
VGSRAFACLDRFVDLGLLPNNPRARGLGVPLGVVTRLIEAATVEWRKRRSPPYLTTIVVSKSGTDAGFPDTSIKDRWPWFNDLTSEEKRARVRDEYRRIMAHGERWLDMLDRAGLPPLPEGEPPEDEGQSETDGRGGWGGGESPEHLALKQYALEHPELFDAPTEVAQPEYPLLSGDVASFGAHTTFHTQSHALLTHQVPVGLHLVERELNGGLGRAARIPTAGPSGWTWCGR